ncbi:MAG: RDD family protein [Gammaproteobacteria bacterium]|nr:RDD family protein [Gammaproteobacteria bacterium]
MSEKSKATAFLLCFFLGSLGVHRFYLGRIVTGLLMLLTLGLLGLWTLVDLVLILRGRLGDRAGNALRTRPLDPGRTNAGFWVRFAAMTADGLILMLVQLVFVYLPLLAYLTSTGLLGAADPERMTALAASVAPIIMMAQAVVLLINVGYFVGLTAGKRQGTIGKHVFGIYVRRRSGDRVGVAHSLLRFVGYIISAIPLYIGFLMAAFNRRKLALHDLVAGTEVVFGTPEGADDAVSQGMGGGVARTMPATGPAVTMVEDEPRASRAPEMLIALGLILILASLGYAYMR